MWWQWQRTSNSNCGSNSNSTDTAPCSSSEAFKQLKQHPICTAHTMNSGIKWTSTVAKWKGNNSNNNIHWLQMGKCDEYGNELWGPHRHTHALTHWNGEMNKFFSMHMRKSTHTLWTFFHYNTCHRTHTLVLSQRQPHSHSMANGWDFLHKRLMI